MRRLHAIALALSILTVGSSGSAEAQFAESLVRAPTLAPPAAASLAGAYAKTAFGAADLARGTFALPGPFVLPEERAQPGIALTPDYSPENGLSEWGLGWSVRLEIRRFRALGELSFDEHDDLDTPWGRAVRGLDGTYYMHGLSSRMLVRDVQGDLVATSPEGTRFTFSRAVGIAGARGTYQWNLVRVESVLGDVTTLVWQNNRYARPVLRSVQYGARGTLPAQVEVRYEYEPVDATLLDYRAERMVRLAERVSTVEVRVRHAERGTFELRWYYGLSYDDDPAGPAFYLEQVQRRFASGAQDPAFTYRYDRGFLEPSQLVPEATSALDGVLSALGRSALMPESAARFDADADGVSELEHQAGQDQLRMENGTLTLSSLPRDGSEDPLCRPARASSNAVRTLVRLRPEDDEPRVLHLLPRAQTTELRVCDRQGHLLERSDLAGHFSLQDANLTLGDVNRDGRPDLLRVFGSGYQLILNDSDAAGFRFRVLPAQRIDGTMSPQGVFARDMNGDGQVDIVVRYAGGLGVLFGQGNLSFSRQLFAMTFRSASGTAFSPSSYSFTFFDGNHDGLADLVLAQGSVVLLFANRGREFVEQPAPRLRTLAASGYPLVDDLTGSGELTLYHVSARTVQSVPLTRPSSGLMTEADDGKGTRLSFAYRRRPPEAGSHGMAVVLSELTHASSGEDTITHRYELTGPVLHPTSHALIGFTEVMHTEPLHSERTRLHHDADVSNVLLETHELGEGDAHQRFVQREHEERSHQGIRYWRHRREQQGLKALDGTLLLSRESRSDAFEAELCPSDVTNTSVHGSVRQRSVRAQPARLADAWHCLSERETWTGRAPDGKAQFEHGLSVSRNDLGQVTSVRALSTGEEVELQHLTYDDDGRLSTLTEAGKGTSSFSYDAHTGMLRSADSPEAVHSGVTAFDPVTDAIAQMERDRGGARFVADYRFDGRERLLALWDNSTGTSEAKPSLTLEYRDPTLDSPGIVASAQSLGDSEAQVRTARYFTAGGDLIASAVLGSDRSAREILTFSEARFGLRNQGTLQVQQPAPAASAAGGLLGVGYAALHTGPELARQGSTGLGAPRSSTTLVQEGVTRRLETTRTVSSAGVLSITRENGTYVEQVLSDLDGRVLSRTDEEGFTTRMDYDALGRLTRVTLASGDTQSVAYDELGRLALVQRDGIGETSYHYLFGTTLLEGKTVRDDLGRTERTVLYQLDHAGRVIEELHTLASTGEEETVRYEYDGLVGGVLRYPGQRGHLTRAVGEGFDKRFVYDAADRLVRSETRIPGFRSLVETATFYANGADRTRTLELTDAAGEPLRTVRQEFEYDGHGRPRTHKVNGRTLLETHYGDRGELERVTGAHGTTYYHYDASTLRERGLTQVEGDKTTDLGWEYDTRGLVATEDYGIDDGATRTRTFGYSPRGFLTRVDDEGAGEAYAYDDLGRRTSADDLHGARTQVRSAGLTMLGTVAYEYDTLGRLSARHGAEGATSEYRYGPRGQLAEATLPGGTLTFAYDHENQRLLKKRDGVPVATYLGEAYLDAEHLVLPVKVGARVLGLLVDGEFEPVTADLRGSVVRSGGRVDVPSAYGVRTSRLPRAEALDYATRGYDAELGFVRMGVRDYDPELGEFVTPDPLFLSAIERCAESPVECNLYGYARGNPLLFIDPLGTDILPPEIQAAMEQGAREVSLQAQAKAQEARESALSYLKEQLRASGDVRGQTDIRYKGKFLEIPDPKEPGKPLVKGAYEVSLAGRLVAGTDGMRFEGTLSIAGELEVKMLHPALLGSYAFGRTEMEVGRIAFNLKNGAVSTNMVNVAISGGLRYDQGLKLGQNVEAKLRAEIGIVGRSVGEQAGRQYNVSAYGRARAEAVLGSYRRRDEANVALKLYDSRASQH